MPTKTVTVSDGHGTVVEQFQIDVPDDPTAPDIVTLANQLSAVTDAVNQLILDALGGF